MTREVGTGEWPSKKCGSPRVTLRLHQLKEKKDKGKGAGQMSSEDFNSGAMDSGGKAGQQVAEDQPAGCKEAASEEAGNVDKENNVETSGGNETASPAEPGTLKRTHSTDEDDDGKKKRRKEESSRGKSGSNSGGSPKSVPGVESEGEDAKSVESPGPKVPPLKIVISSGSLEETGAGGRNGKAGSGRHHLPYVVATSTESEGASPPAAPEDTERGGSAGSGEETPNTQTTPSTTGTASSTRGAHQRVLRSHRVKKNSNSESGRSSKESAGNGGSGNSSPAGVEGGSPEQVSPVPATSEGAGESEEKNNTGQSGSNAANSNQNSCASASEEQPPASQPPPPQVTPQELHPRKRKIRPKENNSNTSNTSNNNSTNNNNSNCGSGSGSEGNNNSSTSDSTVFHHDQISNSYELFLNIRKQIDRKRKGLFPVQPKPPQGFKDYLMNRCTYVLANNANNRVPPPSGNPPASLPPGIRDLFITQEKERHRLLMQHVIEKEKLVLSVEQEILRVHGRAARALANQSLPFSACTILRDEEVYSAITPEQEEKDRNARSRYNGRLFLSWLQDVDDKWEKIKENMLVRHHNEANSLLAIQKMDWEWKMKEIGMCELKATPVIDETHVPLVHVSDDFDLLPA
ncbi:ankyrin repeat domain-containing protein 12 isoform X2 [Cimex lectularius]|uniref:Ankyrin repeat domain-containing protein 12 n=1 Tax=Cimex lectularius TaxID=79782 RepID=A0A8I6RPE1_CIMLE|nr:ankyrin repeat domain-containing protein 12 isoform X2 [Cimex lectularius]